MIETCGFREDIKDIDADNDNDVNDANDTNDNNNKDCNDDKGISALGLDRDMMSRASTTIPNNRDLKSENVIKT